MNINILLISLLFKSFEFGKGSRMSNEKPAILEFKETGHKKYYNKGELTMFNIYHVFAPFVKLHGCRFLLFLQPMWCQEQSSLSDSRKFSLRGVKQKKNDKNMKFRTLNLLYYKRSDWKTWLSERFSEALTGKLWNKKNKGYRAFRNGVKLNYIEPPYGFIKSLW